MTEPTPVPTDVPERFQVRFEGKTLLGIYRVDRELAAGGMGSVYLAQDLNLGRRVVVKVPHGRFLAEPGFRTRFRREVTELVRLEHPHVVRILAQGEEDDVPYFVLQYLGGGSLEERIAKGPQAPETAAQWLTTVAETLDFVHGQGVVHRDVKPGNILFDERGHVFLSDFGVVKALEAKTTSELTEAGGGVGSPLYMAPEQALGRGVTGRADQYALATTLYEALAGSPPYGRGALVEMILKKDKQDAPPLRGAAPAVPEACAAAVARGLRRDPAERFPSCGSLAAAFRSGIAGATTPHVATVSTTAPAPGAAPAGARRRLATALGSAAVIAILSALWFESRGSRGKTPEPPPNPPAAADVEDAQQVVRVASTGSEPRHALRRVLTPGTTDRLRTTADFSWSQGEVGAEPHVYHSRSEALVTARVEAVDPAGVARIRWKFDTQHALPLPDDADAAARNQAFFDLVGTVSGTSALAPRGIARDVVVARDLGPEPQAEDAVTTYASMISAFAIAFPTAPVGVGAEWVGTGFEKYGDMTYESTTTYRLLERTGDRLRLKVDTRYGGGKQGVPFQHVAGREWKLDTLTGSTTGEVVLDLAHPLAASLDTKMELTIHAIGEGASDTTKLRVVKAFTMSAKRE